MAEKYRLVIEVCLWNAREGNIYATKEPLYSTLQISLQEGR